MKQVGSPLYNTNVKHELHKTVPVFLPGTLQSLAQYEPPDLPNGLSIYNSTLVLWDEDQDTRLFKLIDEWFPKCAWGPLAIYEHEGTLRMMWENPIHALSGSLDYEVGDDSWEAYHFYPENGILKELNYEEVTGAKTK